MYSATDLVGYLECQHLATLERAAAWGHLKRPNREDRVLDRIQERGLRHEQRFLESLREKGLTIVEVERDDDLPYEERRARGRDDTLAAMREGADVIFQAVLFDGSRLGYADFLRRVPRPSNLGNWSYEVWDTKLARHAKASAVLQLCLYSDMVSELQGAQPVEMHLALGGVQRETVSFRVADYAAYYRLVARDFEAFLGSGEVFPVEGTPEPVEHCGVCRWNERCRKQWRSEDDLSLVAGLSSRQRRALHAIEVTTRTRLAEPAEPLPDRLDGAGREALARIQAQADIQVRGERLGKTIAERIELPRDREHELVPNQGLLMLPEPSDGDLFFDIEGDPFFESDEVDGIDYLFGIIEPGRPDEDGQPAFHAFWSIERGTVTTGAERHAFEAFIDLVMNRLESDPNLHVYHYAAYEPTAVKRLAGRYGTREEEVDQLLRGNVFVDLFRAVRQGVRASVESYSIKRLEPLYGFNRGVDTPGSRSTVYRFSFPLQDHAIREKDRPHDPETDKAAGTVVFIDDEEGLIDLKRGRNQPPPTPASLVPHDFVRPSPKPENLQRLARWVLEYGVDGAGPYRAARDLLALRPPRLGQGEGRPLLGDAEDAQDAARRLVASMDTTYLAIQGPPGSGKSTVGAQMIVDLVAAGKRVGVTANSHKVIGELLFKVAGVASERNIDVAIGQRSNDEPAYTDAEHLADNDVARRALAEGSLDVVGGTTWLWAREDMVESVDVLFIDEAGQMSLADALAASLSASNLVLLGDPQQLDQPLQGVHPPGAERSALAHLLDGNRVMPDHLGLFLDGTWRLHPDISAFTSEVFYEGRLHSHPDRDRLDLEGTPPLSGTGIRFLPVQHAGQSSESPEEAEELATLVGTLLDGDPTYMDAGGSDHSLDEQDILVITPYNAQVKAIKDSLPDFRIGTVDKFQGQEAPISIYSMATSSADEAPRGMEFLYSLNRLNVATSRAQCLAVVVASPDLIRVRCRTPRQMRLANALARLIEVAGEG